MPANRVIFHRLAAREYRSARDWYWRRSSDVAERFRIAVKNAISRIAADGESLPTHSGAYKYVRIARFPYVLIVRASDGGTWMIVTVTHTSRRPGYWRRRG